MTFSGQIVDPHQRRIYPGEIHITQQIITHINELAEAPPIYLFPGFIDAHIHIESSMLVPSHFASLAVLHGTIATVSDPHEIGNVLGVKGVEFMINNGAQVPFKFFFGAPSCVPATNFETAGATIDAEDLDELLALPHIKYLSEMMNYPGVLHREALVWDKMTIAKKYGKPIDGHAPGLRGEQMAQYAAAGISTDHECFTYEEALDKIKAGMHILIREGSAAKNFDALIDLLPLYPDKIMFCSDDKHPDELIQGHMNELVKRALQKGIDLFDILQATTLNPIKHYQLEVGSLKQGDWADFIIVDDIANFHILQTVINGEIVAKDGISYIPEVAVEVVNKFQIDPLPTEAFQVKTEKDIQEGQTKVRVIKALDGQLITEQVVQSLPVKNGYILPDPDHDILKIAIINRYQKADVQVGFITNVGIQDGAIASCVAHDSHNIIVVGTSDEYLMEATNLIIEHKGGISVVGANKQDVLPLPIGGIMTDLDGREVGKLYAELDHYAKQLGSTLEAPFMTLSFMGLLVIPSLKLSDLGLFDGDEFRFVSLEYIE